MLAQHLASRAVLHDEAVLHVDDAVGDVPGEVHLVCDDDHRALLAGELANDGENLLRQLGIERGGRLVEAEDLRVHRQRAGDGDALALPAGEIAGVFARLVGEADLLQQQQRLLLGLLRAAAQDHALGHGQVFEHAVVGEEVVILEDEAHLEADAAQVALALVGRAAARVGVHHRLPADEDGAAVDGLQMVEAAKQRRFARAAAPDDRDDLAAGDAEGDAPQDAGFAKALSDVDRLKHRVSLL